MKMFGQVYVWLTHHEVLEVGHLPTGPARGDGLVISHRSLQRNRTITANTNTTSVHHRHTDTQTYRHTDREVFDSHIKQTSRDHRAFLANEVK